MQVWRTIIGFLLNALFPRHCLACGQAGTYLCPACLAACKRATNGIFSYRDPVVRQALWLLKYRGVWSLAEVFGTVVAAEIVNDLADWRALTPDPAPFLIVPVPLSAKRERARGFNQAALVTKALATALGPGIEFAPDILQKIKNTPPQVETESRAARLKNLAGAFAVADPNRVKHRTIILLDDVVTTGATLNEARRTLLRTGARAVHPLALAES